MFALQLEPLPVLDIRYSCHKLQWLPRQNLEGLRIQYSSELFEQTERYLLKKNSKVKPTLLSSK